MSIEKDILQTRKFRNEHHKCVVNLIYTHNWVTEQLKLVLEEEELTLQQYNILRILRGSDTPLSTLQIRERMLDKMSDTSRIVDRLILKNLALKSINKKDKRLVDVKISAKGKRLLQKLDQTANNIDNVLKNVSETDARELNRLLDKVRGSV
ncbi:DNA-binding MarR family transcriptional regulator [Lacibacter cauensis]|uniref:DNA-binding MarR family transcriptional regulator n=1 Tax=Lacibacter cauensis TaxID=510947 RepID=A0A562SQE7_9BACT|nr:MarR family transcriptional regulator [Lacibacter cauensis]TWI83234.1 DNA-binding MarR family transcriptional regulator [Lacibacter cauensis]